MITESPQGTASDYRTAYADLGAGTMGLTLLPQGSTTITGCSLEWTGGTATESWSISIDAQKLGTFTVEEELVTAFSATLRDGSGSVTIDGYDADAQSVCGSIDLVASNDGHLRGAFVASIYCTD